MAVTVLIGLQWGDEGKGKIIDVMTEKTDVVSRFQGGSNAGHTVEIGDKKYVLHLIPSGVLRESCDCVIGNGVVVDPLALCEELDMLFEQGLDGTKRLHISDRSHLVFRYHRLMDGINENGLGEGKIGTTQRGIGPAYADKAKRCGIRAASLRNLDHLKTLFVEQAEAYNQLFKENDSEPMDIEKEWKELEAAATRLAPMVTDTVSLLNSAVDQKKTVLFEGAQGSWLDIDFGTYPFVTSSTTTAAGACCGSGVPPTKIGSVLGVTKAYCTRVGRGPFPTESTDTLGENLRKAGNEFGATTGRPRRCGWFDAVSVRYSVMLNGVDSLAITKLDVMDGFEEMKICTAYELDGQRLDVPPSEASDLDRVKPIYETYRGWQCSTRNARKWSDLPEAARLFLTRLAESVGARIDCVSVGPKREETFRMQA